MERRRLIVVDTKLSKTRTRIETSRRVRISQCRSLESKWSMGWWLRQRRLQSHTRWIKATMDRLPLLNKTQTCLLLQIWIILMGKPIKEPKMSLKLSNQTLMLDVNESRWRPHLSCSRGRRQAMNSQAVSKRLHPFKRTSSFHRKARVKLINKSSRGEEWLEDRYLPKRATDYIQQHSSLSITRLFQSLIISAGAAEWAEIQSNLEGDFCRFAGVLPPILTALRSIFTGWRQTRLKWS